MPHGHVRTTSPEQGEHSGREAQCCLPPPPSLTGASLWLNLIEGKRVITSGMGLGPSGKSSTQKARDEEHVRPASPADHRREAGGAQITQPLSDADLKGRLPGQGTKLVQGGPFSLALCEGADFIVKFFKKKSAGGSAGRNRTHTRQVKVVSYLSNHPFPFEHKHNRV